jgi:hypothetical protein
MGTHRIHVVALTTFLGIVEVQLAGCGMSSCIAEGTLISTPEGVRPTESLRPGDRVVSLDAGGEQAVSIVVGIRQATATRPLQINLSNDQSLVTTAEHPIWTETGWIEAGSLANEAVISTESGSAQVAFVRPINRPLRVYDLTVSPHENFYANGVLVHNKTVAQRPRRDDFTGEWIMRGEFDVWYVFTFHADGSGTVEYASRDLSAQGQKYVRKPLEFVSWSVKDYDVEVRVKRWTGELLVMKGFAGHYGLTTSQTFTLDGMLVERPERLLMQLEALGVRGVPNHPAQSQ